MNKLEIKRVNIPYGYETEVFFIDGTPLYEYYSEWLSDYPVLLQQLSPVDYLDITWTDDYTFESDARFMRYILDRRQAITPILSCPDDFDFSCIVIVADVIRLDNKVIWKRIGMIDHSDESFEVEKRSGILFTETYTDEDWQLYGDNIALAEVDSPEWLAWIYENGVEECYRRRINYTFPYYQDESQVHWFANCSFEFEETEYDMVVKNCFSHC